MIERSKFPRPKTVMLINDVPVKSEISEGEKFSSVSNMNLLSSLRTGRINQYGKTKVDSTYKGINSIDIFTTYLDYSYYGEEEVENNFDFNKEFKKRKDLTYVFNNDFSVDEPSYLVLHEKENDYVEEDIFYKLDNQKDVFVSNRLWNEFQKLLNEIRLVKPKLIIVTGKWSLFFLTGCTSLTTNMGNAKDRKPLGGLNKFRSSILSPSQEWNLNYIENAVEDEIEYLSPIIVPIFHTIHSMSMPDKLSTMVLDIEKLGWMYSIIKEKGVKYYSKSDKEYIIGTEKEIILNYLSGLLKRLQAKPTLVSIDIECFFWSVIDCIGITDSIDSGLCIPFAHKGNPNYWNLEDETEILCALREVMLHSNCLHVGQNYSFDCQYFHKLWGIDVKATYDSMILHHVLYNYRPKNLAFLSSCFAETYSYWKEDLTATEETPETRWIYNIKDVQYTLEVTQVLLDILACMPEKMKEFYNFQQNEIAPVLVNMMNRGVRIDLEKKKELYEELSKLLLHIESVITDLLGFEINLKSPIQIKKLFIDLLGVAPIINKKSKSASFGSDAMLVYLDEYPLYKPLITLILEYRSIGVFVRTFLAAKVDEDNRMRTSYNVAGTKSYRLSSRKNAFGNGANLANIPSKGKIDLKYALMEYQDDSIDIDIDGIDLEGESVNEGITKLPNIKSLFLPDEGYTFFNIDYSGADAMVVAYDSECDFLINFFATSDEKLYIYLAREFLQKDITTSDPFYKKMKQWCHLSNYGGMPEKAAMSSGLELSVARDLREWYFHKDRCYPILEWHKRIASDVHTKGYIENIFGARFWLLDKNCPTLLNQAYALIPQSTIGILANKGIVNIEKASNGTDIQTLLQVHDAAAGQFLTSATYATELIKKCMNIELPYKKPLIIPAEIELSTISYGDVH